MKEVRIPGENEKAEVSFDIDNLVSTLGTMTLDSPAPVKNHGGNGNGDEEEEKENQDISTNQHEFIESPAKIGPDGDNNGNVNGEEKDQSFDNDVENEEISTSQDEFQNNPEIIDDGDNNGNDEEDQLQPFDNNVTNLTNMSYMSSMSTCDEVFITAREFSALDNSVDWDALVTRGTGAAPVVGGGGARDSLFLKFDPLCASPQKPLNNGGFKVPLPKAAPPAPSAFQPPPSPIAEEECNIGNMPNSDSDEAKIGPDGDNNGNSEEDQQTFDNNITNMSHKSEDVFINATEFSTLDNSVDWDALMTRGTGAAPVVGGARVRDSLFMKFDPLCSSASPQKPLNDGFKVPLPKSAPSSFQPLIPKIEITSHESNELLDDHDGVNSSKLKSGDTSQELVIEDHMQQESPKPSEDAQESVSELQQQGEATKPSESVGESESSSQVGVNQKPKAKSSEATELMKQKDKQIAELQKAIKDEEEKYKKKAEKEDATLKAVEKDIQAKTKEFEDLTARLAKNKSEISTLEEEKKLAREDLSVIESAFTEVLLNYESTKAIQRNFEQNDKILECRAIAFEKQLALRDEKIQYIENRFEETKQQMTSELEATLKDTENENFKLKASIRMADMKVEKLEQRIQHLSVESQKLQNLCDEMIDGRGRKT